MVRVFSKVLLKLIDKVECVLVHSYVGLLVQIEATQQQFARVLQALLVAEAVKGDHLLTQVVALVVGVNAWRAVVVYVPVGHLLEQILQGGYLGFESTASIMSMLGHHSVKTQNTQAKEQIF